MTAKVSTAKIQAPKDPVRPAMPTGSGLDVARQYAANAITALRAGDVENGLTWLRGFVERHTNMFTRGMLESALANRWDEVIASLEHQLRWFL